MTIIRKLFTSALTIWDRPMLKVDEMSWAPYAPSP
jgi:hypothetical protein